MKDENTISFKMQHLLRHLFLEEESRIYPLRHYAETVISFKATLGGVSRKTLLKLLSADQHLVSISNMTNYNVRKYQNDRTSWLFSNLCNTPRVA